MESDSSDGLDDLVAYTWKQHGLDAVGNRYVLIHGYFVTPNKESVEEITGMSSSRAENIFDTFRNFIFAEAQEESLDELKIGRLYAIDAAFADISKPQFKRSGEAPFGTERFFQHFDPNPRNVYSGSSYREGENLAIEAMNDRAIAICNANALDAVALAIIQEHDTYFDMRTAGESLDAAADLFTQPQQAQLLLPQKGIGSRKPSLHPSDPKAARSSIELVAKLLYDANRARDTDKMSAYAATLWGLAERTPYEPVVSDLVTTIKRFSTSPRHRIRPVIRAHIDALYALDSGDENLLDAAYARIGIEVKRHLA